MGNLKVCMVTDSLFRPGGIATVVRELSYQLVLKGAEIHVITSDGKYEDPKKLLRILNVASKDYPFALWDIAMTSVNTSVVINAMSEDFDLIHVHGPLALTKFFTRKYRSTPWLVTVHGTFRKERTWLRSYPKVNVDMLKYWLGTRLFIGFESWLYNSLSSHVHFIAVAKQTKDDLVNMRVNEKKIFVVPNGVNTDVYRPIPIHKSREKLNMENLIGQDGRVVLSVNFFEPRKGIHVLIKAFHKVLREVKNAHCIIVGTPELNGYLKYLTDLVSKLSLEKNVHFTGFVPDEILPYYFGSCDIFVLPSLAEGAPLVVPMAMACRKPVIATTACAADEYLEPQCTTIPGNYKELAEKLIYYLVNEEEAENLADRLYKKAVEELTWDNIAKKTLDVYSKILRSPNT